MKKFIIYSFFVDATEIHKDHLDRFIMTEVNEILLNTKDKYIDMKVTMSETDNSHNILIILIFERETEDEE